MKKTLLLSAVAMIAGFTGCEEPEVTTTSPVPASISFASEFVQFSESDPQKAITLQFNGAVASAGTITLQVTSDHLSAFTFSPALQNNLLTLSIPGKASSATFHITPTNNSVMDGNKTLTFTIKGVTGPLAVGEKSTLVSQWVDDEVPASISFVAASTVVNELEAEGKVVTLQLSQPAPAEGKIMLTLGEPSDYGKVFTTVPAAEGNRVEITVPIGATTVSFVVLPVNDAIFNYTRTNTFVITHVSGGVRKGENAEHNIQINDDEVAGKARGYTTGAGMIGLSKTFHYAEDGKIASVAWAQNGVEGMDTYHYTAGELSKVVKSTGREVIYLRENGRIVKSEEYANGLLKQYMLFGYDAAGNIGEMAVYDRQPNGSFVHSLHFVYLYYTNGNLYKKMAFNPVGESPEDYHLLSTDTYEQYLNKLNPFGLEIIPGKSLQPNLPTRYTHQNGDIVLNYTLSYEYLPNGQVKSRTVTGQGAYEVANYLYY